MNRNGPRGRAVVAGLGTTPVFCPCRTPGYFPARRKRAGKRHRDPRTPPVQPMSSGDYGRRELVLVGILIEGGLVGLAWVLGWLIGQPAFASLEWDARDAALGAAASVPMLLLFLVCVHWPLGPLAGVRRF